MRPARSPTRRARSRPRPRTCRSAPRSRPRSLEQTSASMEQISATVKKNAENAQQRQPVGRKHRAKSPSRGGEVVAQAVKAMSRIEDRRSEDRRHHRRHRRDRAPDQPAGAQRRGRGRARRRRRPRLRGGGVRGPKPRAALVAGRKGHQGPDHQLQQPGEGRRRSGQPGRAVAHRDREIDPGRRRDRVRHRRASAEQASGVDQVNKALAQMDEVTQQNSALVEENAATAKTLEQQAKTMDERVGSSRSTKTPRRRSRRRDCAETCCRSGGEPRREAERCGSRPQGQSLGTRARGPDAVRPGRCCDG